MDKLLWLPFLETPGTEVQTLQISEDLLVTTLRLRSRNKCHFHYQSPPHGQLVEKEKKSTLNVYHNMHWYHCCELLSSKGRLGYHFLHALYMGLSSFSGKVLLSSSVCILKYFHTTLLVPGFLIKDKGPSEPSAILIAVMLLLHTHAWIIWPRVIIGPITAMFSVSSFTRLYHSAIVVVPWVQLGR